MMGRLESSRGRIFHGFCLDDGVRSDHLVRKIDAVLDPSWLRGALDPYDSRTRRPPTDPEPMMRMLLFQHAAAQNPTRYQ